MDWPADFKAFWDRSHDRGPGYPGCRWLERVSRLDRGIRGRERGLTRMTRRHCQLLLTACALLAIAGSAAQAQSKDPPPPQKVFQYSTRADAERIYLDFSVLNGFYLYRARFGFDSGTNGVAIGAASFPRGETHTDEFFGEQEIYRGKFAIAIPYKRAGPAQTLDLNLRLQG